jgi:hypothetical protein
MLSPERTRFSTAWFSPTRFCLRVRSSGDRDESRAPLNELGQIGWRAVSSSPR